MFIYTVEHTYWDESQQINPTLKCMFYLDMSLNYVDGMDSSTSINLYSSFNVSSSIPYFESVAWNLDICKVTWIASNGNVILSRSLMPDNSYESSLLYSGDISVLYGTKFKFEVKWKVSDDKYEYTYDYKDIDSVPSIDSISVDKNIITDITYNNCNQPSGIIYTFVNNGMPYGTYNVESIPFNLKDTSMFTNLEEQRYYGGPSYNANMIVADVSYGYFPPTDGQPPVFRDTTIYVSSPKMFSMEAPYTKGTIWVRQDDGTYIKSNSLYVNNDSTYQHCQDVYIRNYSIVK